MARYWVIMLKSVEHNMLVNSFIVGGFMTLFPFLMSFLFCHCAANMSELLEKNKLIVTQITTLSGLMMNLSSCVNFDRYKAVSSEEEMDKQAEILAQSRDLYASKELPAPLLLKPAFPLNLASLHQPRSRVLFSSSELASSSSIFQNLSLLLGGCQNCRNVVHRLLWGNHIHGLCIISLTKKSHLFFSFIQASYSSSQKTNLALCLRKWTTPSACSSTTPCAPTVPATCSGPGTTSFP